PDLLLVSAGFDAHVDDQLASCAVTEAGFEGMAALMLACARELSAPLGIVLEGGYELGALSRSVVATLAVVGGSAAIDPPEVDVHPLAREARERLVETHWPSLP
ncbi:MAG TPA: histone deacetylase, partial [Solirubrobacteraceae bacterium]|nr:histone deacetylase [Solirubrobacteraceae bacterium]